jgi:hypothetical protein
VKVFFYSAIAKPSRTELIKVLNPFYGETPSKEKMQGVDHSQIKSYVFHACVTKEYKMRIVSLPNRVYGF